MIVVANMFFDAKCLKRMRGNVREALALQVDVLMEWFAEWCLEPG